MNNEIITKANTDIEVIKHRIYEVRGLRVMIDRDLAELYGVDTKVLNQAVKRNIERFPEDFMFRLNKSEWVFLRSQIVTLKESTINADTEDIDVVETSLRSQFVTLNNSEDDLKSQIVISNGRGQHSKYLPYAFTELGIAMLSSVLRSETAIQVNINIMRAFVAIRHAIGAWQGVNLKVEQLEHKVDQLNNYVEEILHDQNDINQQQDETNNEVAIQIEAINDALDQLREKHSSPRKRIGFKQEDK
jgi:archaellum component FlaC